MDKRKIIDEEMDGLRGNLNRMCVTDDVQELDKMRKWALRRIERIYNARLENLMQENAKKLDNMYPVTEECSNAQYRPPRRGR